jgi:hypothetical protein
MLCLSHTHTHSLSLSVFPLASSLSPPLCFAYKPFSLIAIKSSDKHRCFTQRAEHDKCRKKWVGWRWISLLKSVHCTTDQDLRPGPNLIKLFGINLPTLFWRLYCFINDYNNCLSAVKRSSLQTRVSKFTPKKVLWDQLLAHLLYTLSLHFLVKYLKPKHSRKVSRKCFLSKCRTKHFSADKISAPEVGLLNI